MNPARSRSRWLGTSASAGSSRRVLSSSVDIRNSMPSSVGRGTTVGDRLSVCRHRHAVMRPVRWKTDPATTGDVTSRGTAVAWRSFVAMGDSFTEGMNDAYPDGTYRGWADLVAARLAVDSGPSFGYANLAIRGRLLDQVITEQLEPTLAMKPDLVSFAAGGNDVLRRRMDPFGLVNRLDP